MAKKAARAPKRSATPARPAARKSTPARKTAPRKAAAPLRKGSTRNATTARAAKYVYSWGAGKADGNGSMKPLLGGKGANLAEMARIGLPVPAGFTISTEVCTYYYANKRTYPAALDAQIRGGIAKI
jgi:pyruvate,orthophosphate dikinase